MNPSLNVWLQNPHRHFGVLGTNLAAGDAGVSQTVSAMFQLIDDGVKDPAINRYAIEVLRNCPQYDHMAEVRCLYQAHLMRFRYTMDPVGPLGAKETLRPARELLSLQAGDCDDSTVLMASLAGTVGYPVRIVTVAADSDDPSQFSHVYPEVYVDGRWIPCDAARPGARFALAPQHWYRKEVWYGSGEHAKQNGAGQVHGLNGYAVMGDSTQAQDISSVETGIADIVAASRGNAQVYANLTPGGAPTPYVPALQPGQTYLQSSGAISTGTLLFIGLGLGALLLLTKK